MISVENLAVEFGATPLFQRVSYVINDKDRIALVGKNGAGKSTMLKIIAGMQQPTSGVVSVSGDTTIGYLPQVMVLSDEHTVMEEAEQAFAHISEMQERIDRMNDELAERTDYESEEYMQLVEKFTHESERFQMMGGMNYQAEIERTLMGLGFVREDFDRPTREFSGGWRMRIELAKLLLRKPDVLLLDEPTNHLDLNSISWLETYLLNYPGAVLIVSHDRYFLNRIATKIIEIDAGEVTTFQGNYSDYAAKKSQLREARMHAWLNQQREIKHQEYRKELIELRLK